MWLDREGNGGPLALAKVEIRRNLPFWSSHSWVETALRALDDARFCVYSEHFMMKFGRLQNTMLYELESWPGIEHGVEFVGHE